MADPTLLQSLGTTDTWYVAGVALGLGAAGGLVHFVSVLGTPGVQPADQPKAWREILIGAVAAVGILFVIRPSDGIALVSASLIAGYGGRAIMAALEDKAKVVISQQQLAQAQRQTIEASTKAAVSTQYLKQLVGEVERAQTPPTGSSLAPLHVDARLLADVKAQFK